MVEGFSRRGERGKRERRFKKRLYAILNESLVDVEIKRYGKSNEGMKKM